MSPSVAANAARDVGGRLAVVTLWGTKAGGGSYAALAALTNIPATLIGAMLYEFVFADSSRGEGYVGGPAHILTDTFPSSHYVVSRRVPDWASRACRTQGEWWSDTSQGRTFTSLR